MSSVSNSNKSRPEALASRVYQSVKDDIFDFRLLPGDRFSENDIAEKMQVSRTPVRQALYWLAHEGYLEVYFRSGWQVKPFDFEYFEELYDFRTVLECEAVRRLCRLPAEQCRQALTGLQTFWIDTPPLPLSDGKEISACDEEFHRGLLDAAGNREMAKVHAIVTEKIRIIRRLDFTREDRISATYREHALILNQIFQQNSEEAQLLLTRHIAESKAEVRKITLHMLQQARTSPES